MYRIDIANSQDVLEIDEAFLREIVERTLAEEQVAAAEISLVLVDNAAIRQLNRQYLNHDYDTDVLSFLLESEPAAGEDSSAEPPRGRGKRIEGEVIVSTEIAVETAAEFGWSARDEVVLYLVHGVLHLVGYDDLSDDEKRLMRARERSILGLWKLVPRYADGEPPEKEIDPLGPNSKSVRTDPVGRISESVLPMPDGFGNPSYEARPDGLGRSSKGDTSGAEP